MSGCRNWISVKPVTPEVIKICLEVKPCIERMAKTTFQVYNPLVYASQVVEGTNYLVKVGVDGDVFAHAIIFEALPCYGGELSVNKILYPVTSSDPPTPF